VLLRREGWTVGKYLVERLYREEGLTLQQRRKRRRRVAEHRRERFHPSGPNQVWSMDFVADPLADGRRFRSLTVVDIYTRECLAIESGQKLKSEEVVRTLNWIKTSRGVPKKIPWDNRSEFCSQAMDLWAYQHGVRMAFSRPGKPTDNPFVELFNGTFRPECLNAHWFSSLTEAQRIVETWRGEYNESRPQRVLREKTPNEFAREIGASRDFPGLQTAENSLKGWSEKAGPISDVDSLAATGTKTRAGQPKPQYCAMLEEFEPLIVLFEQSTSETALME
jgi:putative transposase